MVPKSMGVPDADAYTAVVYFHGMGQQRRHEEISGLVQQIDMLVARRHSLDPDHYPDAHLADRHVYEEPGSDESDPQTVVYQEVRNPAYRASGGSSALGAGPTPRIRFYEAYWAPQAAGGTNAVSVLLWAARQWIRPIAVLMAPWRDMATLRLATLYGVYEERYEGEDLQAFPRKRQSVEIIQHLMASYRAFGHLEAYTDPRFPAGSFPEFLQFLAEHPPRDQVANPLPPAKVEAWARYWHQTHRREQWQYLATTVLLAVALFGLLVLALGGLSVLLSGPFHALIRFLGEEIAAATGSTSLPRSATSETLPTIGGRLVTTARLVAHVIARIVGFLLQAKASLAAVVAAGLVAVLLAPLRDYLGDVQQYVTYQETDLKYARRLAILQNTTAVLWHVLRDPHCRRVVVVAHSLGTVIAHDTLLGLHRPPRKAAAGPAGPDPTALLAKITHFVTMGSPINKVEYFFATTQSKVPMFLEVVSDLRGDLGTVPFSYSGRPHVHWVNYWDQGDVVSGPLHAIVGEAVDMRAQHVDNVRIASYAVPNPVRSHRAYLRNPDVLGNICDMIFDNHYSFATGGPQEWLEDIYRPTEQAAIRDRQLAGLSASLIGVAVVVNLCLLWFVDQHPRFAQLVVVLLAGVVTATVVWLLARLVAGLRGRPVTQTQPPNHSEPDHRTN